MNDKLSKADLHMHTNFSDGKPTPEEIIDYVVNKTDLNIIAITDHDTIEGAKLAQRIVKEKKLDLKIIIGEEISAKEGHIVGLFLKKVVPKGLSAKETIKRVKEQKGLVVIPHPFYYTPINTVKMAVMNGIGLNNILKNLKNIDAIETVDNTPTLADENFVAHFWNSILLHKPETGSSDAHIKEAIGMGFTLFEGETKTDLRKAILNGQTKAIAKRWHLMGLLKYGYFFFPKAIRLGFYKLFSSN